MRLLEVANPIQSNPLQPNPDPNSPKAEAKADAEAEAVQPTRAFHTRWQRVYTGVGVCGWISGGFQQKTLDEQAPNIFYIHTHTQLYV